MRYLLQLFVAGGLLKSTWWPAERSFIIIPTCLAASPLVPPIDFIEGWGGRLRHQRFILSIRRLETLATFVKAQSEVIFPSTIPEGRLASIKSMVLFPRKFGMLPVVLISTFIRAVGVPTWLKEDPFTFLQKTLPVFCLFLPENLFGSLQASVYNSSTGIFPSWR